MRGIVLWLVVAAGFSPAQARVELPTDPQPTFRMACWKGDLDQVEALFAQGVPLEEGDVYLRTPLILAAHGNPEVVKFLLAQGAKVNAVAKNGDSAFDIACEHGVLANAQMLLAAGADINHANQWGRTPLMLAAREGHDDVISFLIAQHIDVNFCQASAPAIFYAIRNAHISIVQLLLDAGAQLTLPLGIQPADPKEILAPAMVDAVSSGDVRMVDFLLAHGIDINELTSAHKSPLLVSCFDRTRLALMQHLLEKGADPNIADNGGTTPLIAAVDNMDTDALGILVQHGANLEASDKDGRTALIEAARLGAKNHVFELIRLKANVNATDNFQETALTYAGDLGQSAVVKWLTDAGAQQTELHIIARAGPSPPLSKPRLWAISIGAIYAQHNGSSHLGLLNENPYADLETLKRDRDAANREQLLKDLQDLKDGSALPGSDGAVGIPPGTRFSTTSPDPKWPEKMKVAWNECRAVNLIRVGVSVHFLTETEAWPMLMDIARKTQATFRSWKEMNDAFLDGRQAWAGQRDPDYDLCAQLLLNPKEPNSPWSQLDWNTDLDTVPAP